MGDNQGSVDIPNCENPLDYLICVYGQANEVILSAIVHDRLKKIDSCLSPRECQGILLGHELEHLSSEKISQWIFGQRTSHPKQPCMDR